MKSKNWMKNKNSDTQMSLTKALQIKYLVSRPIEYCKVHEGYS